MAKQTTITEVSQANTFDQWRQKTNEVITHTNNQEDFIGDIAQIESGNTNLVDAVNEARGYSVAISIALG